MSLINNLELHRITREYREIIPTLPIHNITLIEATGPRNKTVKKQVLLDIANENQTTQMRFLVANSLPFDILIRCDMLRQHSAFIDLKKEKSHLVTEDTEWTT